jgi:NDP-sugar pyrophosphorylase family protein
VASGGLRDWAPRAFADFARLRPLHAIGTRGLPWTEIDFPQDYERAVNDVLPAIEDARVRLKPDAAVVSDGNTTVIVRSVRVQPDLGSGVRPDLGPGLLPAVNE